MMKTRIQTENSSSVASSPEHCESSFSKFCKETSLHGWHYFNHEMSRLWKTIWILFLCCVIGISALVLVINVRQYLQVNLGWDWLGEVR
jgi:hypothetical protein